LLQAIAGGAPFERRLGAPVAAVHSDRGGVEVHTRDGAVYRGRCVVVAVPLNALAAISFLPSLSEVKQEAIALGQASRGVKLFIHARGEPVSQNAIRPGHPFGYLDTEAMFDDGTQLMIGFGPDASLCSFGDLGWVQRELDNILPGYSVLDATAHDWLADEFSLGTWAIHRPGWYSGGYHSAMRSPDGRVLLAGSDLANGWVGFIDGAIESGLRAGAWAAATAVRSE
jgi:monoamine oxidase